MSGESTSTHPQPLERIAPPARLDPSERYQTFAEYVATTESLAQAAATTLDVARAHAFTGELTFATEPTVRMYLDGGVVYYAERVGDRSLGSRLLEAGVIDTVQLRRGVVTVGDVDHLGRFFDRDPSVDRDAVMVAVDAATADLVERIANTAVAGATAVAYRHHPSGLHRWFVAPIEPTGLPRPPGGVMQIDRSVVEDLPRLSASSTAAPRRAGSSGSGSTRPETNDRVDAGRRDQPGPGDPHASQAAAVVDASLGEFRVRWPDGSGSDPMAGIDGAEPTPERTARPHAHTGAESTSEVLDDVSGAVRRALHVMNDASQPLAAPTSGHGLDGFAPPTLDTRAEPIDRIVVDPGAPGVESAFPRPSASATGPSARPSASATGPSARPSASATGPSSPVPGGASSAPGGGGADPRRGALRALIDSMRDGD